MSRDQEPPAKPAGRPIGKPTGEPRRPAAFTIEPEPKTAPGPAMAARKPQSFDHDLPLEDEAVDPFAPPEADAALTGTLPRRRGFSFLKLAFGAFSIIISLAIGLWVDDLIRSLFTRADWLGYAALGVVAIGVLAFTIFMIREYLGIARLEAVQTLKAEAQRVATEHRTAEARTLVGRLAKLVAHRPETARGIAALEATSDDIIDAPHLIMLAEREMLAPLDLRARALILGASKRVSVVTAVSPRAIMDLAYVLFEAVRLVRAMAELYGGRPGGLGQLRLMRDVLAHLAVTGSIAVGDSLAQQVLGHGLASRLSARLGEGVINGLMTARIGIAAMDLCRPLPFVALKRPGIGDFMSDLTRGVTGMSDDKKD